MIGNADVKESRLHDKTSYIFVETVVASDAVPEGRYVGAVDTRQTAVEKGPKKNNLDRKGTIVLVTIRKILQSP